MIKSELQRIIWIIRYSNSWDRIVLFVFGIRSICNFRIVFEYPNSCYRIPNRFVFENLTNTEYRIIRFLKIDRIPNTNSTIRSQLFEYRIIRIIRCNSELRTTCKTDCCYAQATKRSFLLWGPYKWCCVNVNSIGKAAIKRFHRIKVDSFLTFLSNCT